MAGRALAKAGGQQSLLDDVIAGTCVLAFAHQEPQNGYGAEDVASHAEQSARGWILNGAKAVVAQFKAANLILVSPQVPGGSEAAPRLGLFLVDVAASGLSVRDYPLIDGGRGGELIMNSTPAALVAERALPLIEDAIAAGIVGLSWEAVGVMDVLKATTLDYLRTRMQFGTPIGKFQTLRHRMATLALEIEQARSSAINASYALESDRQTRERAISAAKYTIGRVGTLVAEEAIQMHGGIGMTWELPLSHYAKRLVMIGHLLGDEDHHLDRYIALGR
jgi:alkylation response protein AidB-like acyl-CoA dehydrogenase